MPYDLEGHFWLDVAESLGGDHPGLYKPRWLDPCEELDIGSLPINITGYEQIDPTTEDPPLAARYRPVYDGSVGTCTTADWKGVHIVETDEEDTQVGLPRPALRFLDLIDEEAFLTECCGWTPPECSMCETLWGGVENTPFLIDIRFTGITTCTGLDDPPDIPPDSWVTMRWDKWWDGTNICGWFAYIAVPGHTDFWMAYLEFDLYGSSEFGPMSSAVLMRINDPEYIWIAHYGHIDLGCQTGPYTNILTPGDCGITMDVGDEYGMVVGYGGQAEINTSEDPWI